jgi:hypothetical protein
MGATTANLIDNATAARNARGGSTTSPARCWPAITSRWVLCLYFMGLNLSNRQIAQELGLNVSDVHAMTEQLRGGLVAKTPPVRLEGEVEIDEVYVVAGHKGQPAAVAKRGGLDAVADWRERRAAARWRRTSHPSSV